LESDMKVETHELRIKALGIELKEAVCLRDSQKKSYTCSVNDMNSQIDELNTQLSIQTELNETATNRSSDLNSKIDELNSQLSKQTELNETATTLSNDLNSQIDELNTQLLIQTELNETTNDRLTQYSSQIDELNTQLSIQSELNDAATSRLNQYSSQIELVAEMVEGGDSLDVEKGGDERKDELSMLQDKILGRLREESAKQEVQVAAIGKRAADSEKRVADVCYFIDSLVASRGCEKGEY
jgi:chromosome segregation ATPase